MQPWAKMRYGARGFVQEPCIKISQKPWPGTYLTERLEELIANSEQRGSNMLLISVHD